jgi:cytochrome c peroxidase
MQALYLTRIADLGRSDFVKVDCAACHHGTLLAPRTLLKLGLTPAAKVLDLTAKTAIEPELIKRRGTEQKF